MTQERSGGSYAPRAEPLLRAKRKHERENTNAPKCCHFEASERLAELQRITSDDSLLTRGRFFGQLLAVDFDHLVLLLLRHGRIARELHGEVALALGGTAQIRRVAEHGVQRN